MLDEHDAAIRRQMRSMPLTGDMSPDGKHYTAVTNNDNLVTRVT
jgi:hypothetical protein